MCCKFNKMCLYVLSLSSSYFVNIRIIFINHIKALMPSSHSGGPKTSLNFLFKSCSLIQIHTNTQRVTSYYTCFWRRGVTENHIDCCRYSSAEISALKVFCIPNSWYILARGEGAADADDHLTFLWILPLILSNFVMTDVIIRAVRTGEPVLRSRERRIVRSMRSSAKSKRRK